MISARLVSQVGVKAAFATPSSSILRERAALLGITGAVKEQFREDELPDDPYLAAAVGGDEDFDPDMPDAVDDGEEGEAAVAAAAVAPSQAPSLPLPVGQRLVTLRPAPSSSSSGTSVPTSAASNQLGASAKARAPHPQEVKPPHPIVKEELGGKAGQGIRVPPPPKREVKKQEGPRNWEVERERKRQALSLRDAGCKAICAIKHALRQPGAQQDGQAFVPQDWDTAYKPLLGSYIKFLLSRPDQFRVIEGAAPGLFTVENVATTELVKAPAWGSWKKNWKGKTEVKSELKPEVKEELGVGQRSWQSSQANRGGAWRQGPNSNPQQGGWRPPWKSEHGGGNGGPQQIGGRIDLRGRNFPQQGGCGWRPGPGGPHRTAVKVEPGARWSAPSTMGWKQQDSRGSWASDDRGGKGGSFQGKVKEEPGTWNPRHRLPPPDPRLFAQAPHGARPSSRPSMTQERSAFIGGDAYATQQPSNSPSGMYGMDDELREVEALPFQVDGDESSADRAWAQAEPAGGDDAIDAWGLLAEQMRDHLSEEGDAKRPRQF